MDRSEVTELIKAIRNRCEIYLTLCNSVDLPALEPAIPTLLEDMCEDAQTIATEYCAENND